MRFLSVLMILAGLAIAFVPPILQTDVAGKTLTTERVFDRARGGWRDGWQPRQFNLNLADGPFRIRLEGRLAENPTNLPAIIPVFVDVAGSDGIVFSGEYEIAPREDNQRNGTFEQRLFISLPVFDILDSGAHELTVRLTTPGDIGLETLDAEIVGNAREASYEMLPAGLGVFGFGTVLYFIASRRRKVRRKRAAEPPRWGRG